MKNKSKQNKSKKMKMVQEFGEEDRNSVKKITE